LEVALVIRSESRRTVLTFVAVVACIGAIASPDSLNAVDRGKQKRTMAAMRSIGAAIEAYSVDNYVYPVAASMPQLRPLIEPRYIKALPMLDGWGNSFQVDSSTSSYTLFSWGKDGAGVTCIAATTTLFNDQVCMVNGGFTRYPVGPQQ
jgi:type II secretory pathway pseudopilin PulG